MVQPAVIDRYDDGTTVHRGRRNFYVETPSGDLIECGFTGRQPYRTCARLRGALFVRFGEIDILYDPIRIPVPVAVSGKPAIAAYLNVCLSVEEESYSSKAPVISELMGVSESTVMKYWNRFISQTEANI